MRGYEITFMWNGVRDFSCNVEAETFSAALEKAKAAAEKYGRGNNRGLEWEVSVFETDTNAEKHFHGYECGGEILIDDSCGCGICPYCRDY